MHGAEGKAHRGPVKGIKARQVGVALVVNEGGLVVQAAAPGAPLPLGPAGRHNAVPVELLLADQGSQLLSAG